MQSPPAPTNAPASPFPVALSRVAETRSRAERSIALWVEHARSALGIRRGFRAEGVYYKELSAERLGPALATRRVRREPNDAAPGHKDYRVTFADGTKMFIHCTRARCYADLMGPEGMERYARAASILRPGSRVLEVAAAPMTTGYTGAWLARMVGHSGAVVSVIEDEESAGFAPRRYSLPNLSFESGPLSAALTGEMNGAFSAVICLEVPADAAKRDARLRELWRVLAPGGWMLAGPRLADGPTDAAILDLHRHLATIGRIMETPGSGAGRASDVLLLKEQPRVD